MLTCAQDGNYTAFPLKEIPVLDEISEAESDEPAVILKDYRLYEYEMGYNAVLMSKTVYKNIRINEEKVLDEFNKIAIPMNGVKNVVSVYARTIGPDGKVVEMNKSILKELTNIEGYGNYKVFAIEGATVGGEIEYQYVLSMTPVMSRTEVFQGDYPVKQGYFEIRTHKKLNFETRSYNGFPELMDVDAKGTKYTATINDIPGMPEEQYSTFRANLMKVSFALTSKDDFLSTTPGLSWDKVQDNLYITINNIKQADYTKASKIKKELNIDDLMPKEKIEAIEDYLKSNYTFNRNASGELKEVYKTKQADQLGMSRLFAAMFQVYHIPYNLVITSNRYYSKFDRDFPVWNDMDAVMFSFPEMDNLFIEPTEIAFRLGMAPYRYTNNDALVIARRDYPDNTSYHFEYLEPAKAEDNRVLKKINLSLADDFSSGIVDAIDSLTGYRAFSSREILCYADEKNKKEFLKYMASSGLEDAEVLNEEILNEAPSKSLHNEPFIYNYKVRSRDFVEKAGNDYIVNIGKVIGKQSELYQERERQQPIHMDHPIIYKYEIRLNIPEGYRIESPDDLMMNHLLIEDSVTTAQFVSDYEITDNQLIIRVIELYTKNTFDVGIYDDFRKVINAASDFSKAKVLLVKNQ